MIDNLKITTKIGLIIGAFAVVGAGAAGYAASRMRAIDDRYSSLIGGALKAATLDTRANVFATEYLETALVLTGMSTEAENALGLADNKSAAAGLETTFAAAAAALQSGGEAAFLARLNDNTAKFRQAAAACAPLIDRAAAATTDQENIMAAKAMYSSCVPGMKAAIIENRAFVKDLQAYADKASDNLTDHTNETIRTMVIAITAGVLITLLGALWIGIRKISAPLRRLGATMALLANGDLAADVPGTARRDELGDMARTVGVFKQNALEAKRAREEQDRFKIEAEARQKAAMLSTADGFEAKVGGLVKQLAAAATELHATSQAMSSTAETTQQKSSVVAAAAEEAAAGVQTVASAAEELTTSIGEISRQVSESSKVTTQAVAEAQRTDGIVRELSDNAQKIGQVVNLISNIAGQTNLLALNATIEAARAGDAGKGFAVVASEVKNLAAQTSKATQEISTQIAQVQASTGEAVAAITEIGTTIEKVSAIAAAIAAAVDQQSAATNEIARNIQQTAASTQEVGSTITEVSATAIQTGSAADQVSGAAAELARQSEMLAGEVNAFVASVRAA